MIRTTFFIVLGLVIGALLYVALTDAQVAPANAIDATRLKAIPAPTATQKYVFHIHKRDRRGSHKTSIMAEMPDGSTKEIATCTGDCTFEFPAEAMDPVTKTIKRNTFKRVRMVRHKCRRCDVVADWEIK